MPPPYTETVQATIVYDAESVATAPPPPAYDKNYM